MSFVDELQKFTDCDPRQHKQKGHLLSCLVDHKEEMANDQQCSRFLTRMETLVFTDFHLVGPFVKACSDDIEKFNCGRLEKEEDAHSQVLWYFAFSSASNPSSPPCELVSNLLVRPSPGLCISMY